MCGNFRHCAGPNEATLCLLKFGKGPRPALLHLDTICCHLDCQPGDLLDYEPGPANDEAVDEQVPVKA